MSELRARDDEPELQAPVLLLNYLSKADVTMKACPHLHEIIIRAPVLRSCPGRIRVEDVVLVEFMLLHRVHLPMDNRWPVLDEVGVGGRMGRKRREVVWAQGEDPPELKSQHLGSCHRTPHSSRTIHAHHTS